MQADNFLLSVCFRAICININAAASCNHYSKTDWMGTSGTNDFCYFWGVNYLLIILGAVSLGLGVAGMFLPVLPTTPFLLLTAWCWMKGAPRLHAWLMAHPKLGPYIRDFQEHKCISRRVKAVSVTTLWLTIALSIILVRPLWLRILLAAVAAGVTVHILSFKTKE